MKPAKSDDKFLGLAVNSAVTVKYQGEVRPATVTRVGPAHGLWCMLTLKLDTGEITYSPAHVRELVDVVE